MTNGEKAGHGGINEIMKAEIIEENV